MTPAGSRDVRFEADAAYDVLEDLDAIRPLDVMAVELVKT
jgi:hypothetical protein